MEEKELRSILESTLRLLKKMYEDQWHLRLVSEATQRALCELTPGFENEYNKQVIAVSAQIDETNGQVLRKLVRAIQKLTD